MAVGNTDPILCGAVLSFGVRGLSPLWILGAFENESDDKSSHSKVKIAYVRE
jgi:hypothetical protein